MGKRAVGILKLIASLVFVATLVLWLRSHFRSDVLNFDGADGTTRFFMTFRGGLTVTVIRPSPDRERSPRPWSWEHNPASPAALWRPRLARRADFMGLRGATIHELDLPYWLPLLATTPGPALIVMTFTRRPRPHPGRCPECGYDTRATPDRCPECGCLLIGRAAGKP